MCIVNQFGPFDLQAIKVGECILIKYMIHHVRFYVDLIPVIPNPYHYCNFAGTSQRLYRWHNADVLKCTYHRYDSCIFDESNNQIDFKSYPADCINDFTFEYLDQCKGEDSFSMTVLLTESHYQNNHAHRIP